MNTNDQALREYLEKKMDKTIETLPDHMRRGIKDYVLDRLEPGGFLRAVLENNLKEAVARADNINQQYLVQWVQFCLWTLPSDCWGSPERVEQWLNPKTETIGDEP